MGRYINHDDVFDRISQEVIIDVFDDEQDGNWKRRVDATIRDAESDLERALKKIYGSDGIAWLREQTGDDIPPGVITLALDAFEWRMGRRHPEYIRGEWDERRKEWKEEMKELRLRDQELDGDDQPEPAYNEGADVFSADPTKTTAEGPRFTYGGGVF